MQGHPESPKGFFNDRDTLPTTIGRSSHTQAIWPGRKEAERLLIPIGSTYPACHVSALVIHFDQPSKVQVNNDRRNWFRHLEPHPLLAYWRQHSAVTTHFRPHQISLTDTQRIDLLRSRNASGIAMFAGKVHLPLDAARIRAAQFGLDLAWPM